MDILTRDEVVILAFDRRINLVKIPDTLINVIQEKHIRPILGDDFYDAVIETPGTYSELIDLLKPLISFYVKYYILPNIYMEIADTGLNQIAGQNRNVSRDADLFMMRAATLDVCTLHSNAVYQHLKDNRDDYPLYKHWKNPQKKIVIAGGIIFEQ